MKKKIENFDKGFLSFYHDIKDNLHETTHHLYDDIADKAADNFSTGVLNLPNKGMEDYKYSDLVKHLKSDFIYYTAPERATVYPKDFTVCNVPELDAETIMLINGWYNVLDDEKLKKTKEGVVFGSLLYAYRNGYKDIIDSYLNKHLNTDSPLVALNNMFAQDGFFVYIPDNVVVSKPIQLINLVSAIEEVFVSPHSLIVAGKNSQAKFLLCEHSIFPKYFLNNSVMQIIALENSHIEYVRLQNAHNESYQFTSTYIYQLDGSNVKTNTVTLHGGVVRNNIVATIDGKGCTNKMCGLFLVDKGQHVDNWTLIDHKQPESNSNELFKGIIDDYATGAFAGKILVRQDSQHTDAQQTNKNILLTSDAKMHTKPQLEIYADDVVCSHGATVGQINEEELFYMRQRGISQKTARLMLLNAFAYEVIKDISVKPVKEAVVDLVDKRLSGDLTRCEKCEIKC
jgi:Fe-S cluster assembly protein SufD